jgi:glycosyltransferase involved in cell wall biosynthesis
MRVALIAPPFIPIPPTRYGGTELFIAHLLEGLKHHGIDTVVYSNGDSMIKTENRWLYPHSEWPIQCESAAHIKDLNHSSWAVADAARDCDVIHINSSAAVAFSRTVQRPVVCTLHHPHMPEVSEFYFYYPQVQYVTISKFQEEQESLPLVRSIHHGLDTSRYRIQVEKRDYLCFLGRIAPLKGTHLAIEVAKISGIPLKIAGEVQPVFREYYETMVKPHIDGRFIEYIGEADLEIKNQLLGEAKALLFPIQWNEPFGLVMLEALACGTPVLALPGGAVAEVISPGIAGEICSSVQEMADTARSLKPFKAHQLRQFVERNFSLDTMTRKYLALYREITGTVLPEKDKAPRPDVLHNLQLKSAGAVQ